MFLHLLALAGLGAGGTPALGQPTISNLVVTPSAGACPAGGFTFSNPVDPLVDASVELSWNISFFNDALYEIHVSENGGAPATQPTSDTNYFRGFPGQVQNGLSFQTYMEFSWTVSLVRKSDGAPLQTLTGTHAANYGGCFG